MSTVDYAVQSSVAVLTVAHPPVNALSLAVRTGLGEGVARAIADPAVKAIVVIGSGTTFIAGADISEFGTPNSAAEPRLQTLQAQFEASPKPIVAAIHGTALGGGLELALTCHARVAVQSAKVGLPEVKLGLLPGAGGTIRLPRLTGVEVALEAITTGRHIGAVEANKLGIVDAIVFDLQADAIGYALKLAAEGTPPPVRDRNDKITDVDPLVFADFRAKAGKKWRGQIAPARIVDVIEAATTLSFAEAKAFENEQFKALMESDQRKALIHYFFAEREARKIPDVPSDVKPLPIRKVVVVGSGLMGGGIAMSFANAGIPVKLLDIDAEALARGMGVIRKTYETSLSRGSITQAQLDERFGRIEPVGGYDDLGDIDMAIEAVFEDMALKQKIFALLDTATPPHAILGTNTSSLDIDQIASATNRPDKVIGAHFFSPANVMKLLEAVRGSKTSAETIATVMALGKQIGKAPVLAGNCDGFIGNRMLQYYTVNAEYMLERGATPEQIDRVAEQFGMAMGPLAMRDLAGMAQAVNVRAVRKLTLPADERMPELVERMVEAGRIGQKSSAGFYRYEGRDRLPDPAALDLIRTEAQRQGIEQRSFTDEEILARLFHPLVNEGAKELEEGIAIRASDIDVAWVNGYGFPVHTGGPMFWGEQIGLDKVLATARTLGAENGQTRWGPSRLLERLVAEGKGWKDAPALIAAGL
ncbi:3-hydroxyacyl-CoA dehydrogenase NAD-binding domain-containing protein [Brevundimonas sp.]|uniref:3-hydroxyacyl-CoA dehydrogenase NAD-binding domain-containing protein n=1 Tax=Brevundimonas sp. TaxID=1871086 RepID=UPI002AB8A502|nr:3-hydroxyacyl-CoA dehydrogenase NAD-binding domain-containing protein [Brevundimonas sp.]MDZ4363311.1 3-hydroxyacyl-CoA dehydrogenase NAD-binding domain-containing protein [Brevundimonas sp.]